MKRTERGRWTPVRLRSRTRPAPAVASAAGVDPRDTACFAPSVQLFLHPDGEVRPCCVHLAPYGNVANASLTEIWEGRARRDLVDRLAHGDYSAGCENCEAEIAMEGREHSYAAFFERRAGHLTADPDSARWPRWIDFNLSTTCNLQCIQCSGELSSSIRIHREKRPPLANPYGDAFFEDLRRFVPHLDGALFAGGEPFLAEENYRVWAMIAELRPDLHCIVTTNGTQWNRRVTDVIERLRMSFVVSIDGFTAATFEAIRVGADRDLVFRNAERFADHSRRRGTTTTINHCLMVQNHHEFADLLLWAERHGLRVDVSVVRTPAQCSIARLPQDRLGEVYAALAAQDDRVMGQLDLNADTWRRELDRVRSWWTSAQGEEPEWGKWGRTVLLFRRDGDGPHDGAAARAELAQLAHDGRVHELLVGGDDLIVDASDSLRRLMSVSPDEFVGQNFALIEHFSVAAFGPLRHYDVLAQTPDRMDARAVYGDTEIRVAMVALRGDDGVADRGAILVAVTDPAIR